MIPKLIHYCWFGKKDKPPHVLRCISSWQEKMPDYKIKEWNEDNFDIHYNRFTEEAYNAGKYAFVSDVARLYAIATEGGIYFDTDIEVLKSFDDLLDQEYILGYEREKVVGTGVMAASPGNELIMGFLKTYNEKPFVLGDGKYNNTPNPTLLMNYIQDYGFDLKVYGMDYFCAKDYKTGKITITENTYCIHHYSGSWLTPWQRFKLTIHRLIGS